MKSDTVPRNHTRTGVQWNAPLLLPLTVRCCPCKVTAMSFSVSPPVPLDYYAWKPTVMQHHSLNCHPCQTLSPGLAPLLPRFHHCHHQLYHLHHKKESIPVSFTWKKEVKRKGQFCQCSGKWASRIYQHLYWEMGYVSHQNSQSENYPNGGRNIQWGSSIKICEYASGCKHL